MAKVNRRYVPYWQWEDWYAGMWRKIAKHNEPKYLKLAFEFTGDWERYGEAMGEVLKEWPNTIENSMTDTTINRRAFLGHCACAYKMGIPEYIVRKAWHLLTDEQRDRADHKAQTHIDNWLRNYERKN